MPEEVEECVESVLEDNPEYSESKAYAICNAQHGKTAEDIDVETVEFKARMTGPSNVFKVNDDGDDRFVIWGKASVEVVDKENDKITAKALQDALPQLLKRQRLSLEHTDQLVGDILESFEADEPTTVKIDGEEYTRKEFPTEVLKLDENEPPALFVAGEVWNDTRQAQKVRDEIEAGTIDSYSISGEAISTSTKVKDGDVYDEISELDLSAVTLCEEGMNHKAKFGTVVKRVGDDSVSPVVDLGKTSNPDTAVAKSNMSDDTKSEEGGGLSREDLRGEFQKAAQAALNDANFVTRSDVEDIVDERLEREDDGDDDDEPSNASEAAGDDMEEQKAEKTCGECGEDPCQCGEKADIPDDDEEEEMDDEKPPEMDDEKPPEMEDEEKGDDEEMPEEEPVDPDTIEDPDGDGEEEVELDPEMDDEMPEEEQKGDLVSQLEAEGVPDDLCEAVEEYVEGEGDEAMEDDEMMDAPEEEPMEMAEKADMGDMDDLSTASDDEQYLDMTASAAAPAPDPDEDLMKSFEHTEKGDDVTTESGTLDYFYESVGEDT